MRFRVLLFSCLIPAILFAQLPNGRTHPELVWRTFDTDHFRIIFHQGLDSLAFNAAGIAEDVYGPIARDLGVDIPQKTLLILTDVDDISNGIANPLDHSIFIWTQDPQKQTTGTLSWLRRLIGHEFGHIATFWACRNGRGKWWELLTLGTMPSWFLEGVAQVESERWGAHRDLLVRSSIQTESLLPLRRMDGFVGADLVDGRLVYEQGHSLMRFATSRYGRDVMRRLIREHRKLPVSFSWSMKRATGLSVGDLDQDWRSAVCEEAADFSRGREPSDALGDRIDIPLQAVNGVRVSPDGSKIAAVGVDRWDEGVARLYTSESDKSNWRQMGGPHVGAYFSWSSDGTRLVASRLRRGKRGSVVRDLYVVDASTGRERRVTTDLRAADPVLSPFEDAVCFVRREAGKSTLCLLNLKTGSLREIADLGSHTELFSPAWSPDGSYIAFSLIDASGQRDIASICADGSGFHKLTSDAVDDRTPTVSPDGAWIAFCRTAGGTPNLFRIRPDGSDLTQMTDVAGGVFNPSFSPDGKTVTAVVIARRDSVAAYTIPASRSVQPRDVSSSPLWAADRFGVLSSETKSVPFDVAEIRPYRSWGQIRPLLTLPFFGQDDGGLQLGAAHYAADPLRKHQALGFATVGRRVDWLVRYTNGQAEPLLTFSTWGSTLDRGNFLGVPRYPLWERRTGLSVEASLPINFGHTLLSNHRISASFRCEHIRVINREQFVQLLTPNRPFNGWFNCLGLGYTWQWERPDTGFDIHPATGAWVSFFGLRAERRLGSDIDQTRLSALAAFRQELPWGRQVAAVRIGGLLVRGETPVQDWTRLGSPHHVRGLDYSRDGDRMIFTNAEYRIPIMRDLGFRIPVLWLERLTGALWTDWGKAWGRDRFAYDTGRSRGFSDCAWIGSAGLELRCRIILWGKLPVVASGGYGRVLTSDNEGTWFWRIGPVF